MLLAKVTYLIFQTIRFVLTKLYFLTYQHQKYQFGLNKSHTPQGLSIVVEGFRLSLLSYISYEFPILLGRFAFYLNKIQLLLFNHDIFLSLLLFHFDRLALTKTTLSLNLMSSNLHFSAHAHSFATF